MSQVCEVCGKNLQSRKAYAGHMLLGHQKRVGFMAEFDAKMQQVSEMEAELVRMEGEQCDDSSCIKNAILRFGEMFAEHCEHCRDTVMAIHTKEIVSQVLEKELGIEK